MNEILGLPMQQNDYVVPFLSELVKVAPPRRIVEIGTGSGGLTVLCFVVTGANVLTFDMKQLDEVPARWVYMNEASTRIGWGVEDVFEKPNVIEFSIHNPFRDEPAWLLCDGGDKNREVETFAPFLKPGDIIAAHDYCPDRDTWKWHEVDEARVNAVAEREGLEVIPELKYDRKAAWWVRRKA
jgi:hypothetical protein